MILGLDSRNTHTLRSSSHSFSPEMVTHTFTFTLLLHFFLSLFSRWLFRCESCTLCYELVEGYFLLILLCLSCLFSLLLYFYCLYLPWTVVSSLLWPQVCVWAFECLNSKMCDKRRVRGESVARQEKSERNEQQICWLLLSYRCNCCWTALKWNTCLVFCVLCIHSLTWILLPEFS